LFAINCVISA